MKRGFCQTVKWDCHFFFLANLKFVLGMQAKRAKKKPVDVFWILSEADIPNGLEFVEDEKNSGHYFLAVTKQKA